MVRAAAVIPPGGGAAPHGSEASPCGKTPQPQANPKPGSGPAQPGAGSLRDLARAAAGAAILWTSPAPAIEVRRDHALTRSRTLHVGLDGGATHLRCVEVVRGPAGLLECGPARATRALAGAFVCAPIPLVLQMREFELGSISIADEEHGAGASYVRSAAEVIAEAARAGGATRLAVGLCLPGLKTSDRRGIAVLRNGPRMPEFLADLEHSLAVLDLDVARPLPPLMSDGVAAASGERRASAGALRDVEDALYIGGGTGLSEALLLGGQILDLDDLDGLLPKAWALEFEGGTAFEDVLSMGGWNRTWTRATEQRPEPTDAGFPEQAALRGDPRAIALLARAGRALGRLCAERVQVLRECRGVVPERCVVGQRLGGLLARADLAPLLREPAERALLEHGLPPGFLHVSRLDEAPAIGAAAPTFGPGV